MYKAVGDDELAERALEFARITWMLLVGEDTTFLEDNAARLRSASKQLRE